MSNGSRPQTKKTSMIKAAAAMPVENKRGLFTEATVAEDNTGMGDVTGTLSRANKRSFIDP